MPTYDYECSACGGKFEIFHPMSESARKKCPNCGKLRLKKLLGAGAGFIFKGSGFYTTDYRSADYKAKAKAETDSCKVGACDCKSPAVASGTGESTAKKKEPQEGESPKKEPESKKDGASKPKSAAS